MALDHPEPLTEEEWNSLLRKLNTPATKEQKTMMHNSIINGKKIETFI